MNISLNKNDDAVSGILKLEVVKSDYADQVEKNLRNFRQKANIPGFRKGMAPVGMIKKMYGKSVLVEEVNKLVSENVFKYIRENQLNILGEPLPNETEQKEINFDTQEDFEFCFDLAFAPEISIDLNKRDKLTYYQVAIDDEMLDKQINSYKANFGVYDATEEEIIEKDLVKGVATELENGLPKEGGLVVEEAILMPQYIKDEEEKSKLIGAKTGNVIIFNPKKAYEGSEVEIASLLKIEKSGVASINDDFSLEIKEVVRHKEAEINQELFDKVFGEGVVKSEDEFKEKIKESILEQFAPQGDYKFLLDARKLLLKKAGEVKFPDEILKRWLMVSGEKKTPEKLEEDYPMIIEDLIYHLIKEDIIKKNDIKVEDADIELFGRRVAKAQFAQYGMYTVPDDLLNNYAKDMLKNKQTLQNVIDRAVEDKLVAWLKGKVKLETKEISVDDFNKLFEEEK
ncbi:MAG: trigger factor [Tannerellaceae bacterium]|jgi:trigger factor|nr:trigger factor [Tannerellaceae bacterium]